MKFLLVADGSVYTKRMLARETVKGFHHDESEKAFKPIRAFFKQRGIQGDFAPKVGPAGDVIAKLASSGSFATKVLAHWEVPVLLVR